jgi:CheY-like chemotaxis protein
MVLSLFKRKEEPPPGREALLLFGEGSEKRVLEIYLQHMGYAAVEAASVVEALAVVDGGRRPELLVIDERQHGAEGRRCARRIRDRLQAPELPVVLIQDLYEAGEGDGTAPLPHGAVLTAPFNSTSIAGALGAAFETV